MPDGACNPVPNIFTMPGSSGCAKRFERVANPVRLGGINRWLSGVEARKIASTPLSERLNLTALD